MIYGSIKSRKECWNWFPVQISVLNGRALAKLQLRTNDSGSEKLEDHRGQ